jgi:hypothetical protein
VNKTRYLTCLRKQPEEVLFSLTSSANGNIWAVIILHGHVMSWSSRSLILENNDDRFDNSVDVSNVVDLFSSIEIKTNLELQWYFLSLQFLTFHIYKMFILVNFLGDFQIVEILTSE